MTRERTKVAKQPQPEKVRVKPEKITAAQLEGQFSQWTQTQQQKLKGKNLGRKAMCGVLLLGIASVAVTQGVFSAANEKQTQVNEQSIESLSAQVNIVDSVGDAEVLSPQDVALLRTDATKAAEVVRDAQNEFAVLYENAAAEASSDTGNGAPGKAQQAIGTHREELEHLFSEDALIVAKQDVPVYTSLPAFADTEIDPRYEWYVRYENEHPASAKGYGWQVETVMPQLENLAKASVVWVNTEKSSGEVLAWATASYDSDKKAFTDVSVAWTSFGAARTADSKKPEVAETVEGVGK